jgi:hypothetical protein
MPCVVDGLAQGPPERLGFGSRFIETSIRTQLGGKFRMTRLPEGVVSKAEIPVQRMTAVPMAA